MPPSSWVTIRHCVKAAVCIDPGQIAVAFSHCEPHNTQQCSFTHRTHIGDRNQGGPHLSSEIPGVQFGISQGPVPGVPQGGHLVGDTQQVVMDFSSRSVHGLVQDCGISSALAMEIPQSCTKSGGLAEDCSISSVITMEISQSCTKPGGLAEDCSISSVITMEIPQSYTKPRGLAEDCSISSVITLEIPQSYTKLRGLAEDWYLQCDNNGDTTVLH